LGLIVTFHEFGHFIVAKANGIGVTEFMVGLGPVIFEKKHKGTRYTIRLILFGGACIMKGDDNGMYTEEEEAAGLEGDDEKTTGAAFSEKSVWARIATIFAGPFFNFILAFVLSIIVLGIAGIDKPYVRGIVEGLPAEAAGLQTDDLIVSVNGHSVKTARDISLIFGELDMTQPVTLVVKRDGEKKTFEMTPVLHTYEVKNEETGETETITKYMVGFSWNYTRTKVGTLETVAYSLNEVWYWIKLTVKSLGMMFTGQVTVNDLSGPVGIAGVVNETVEESKADGMLYIVLNLINLSVLLSADIGVMNLLPIPALDGGRLLFLFIEAVRGKPIDKKKEGYVHLAGIIFLLLLMIFVVFNDFRKILM